jgi:hypothetical protein
LQVGNERQQVSVLPVLTCKDDFTSRPGLKHKSFKRNTLNFAESFSALVKNFLAVVENFLALQKHVSA